MKCDTTRRFRENNLTGGVVIESETGDRLPLRLIMVAAPCVEFARYARRFPDDARPDTNVTEALRFLDDGRRGFYATNEGEPVAVELGARVFLA